MKRMLFICAALLAASIASAQVTSANVVGYQKLQGPDPAVGSFTILAPPFVSVQSDTQEFTLDRITGNFEDFDSLQFFDATGETSLMAFWLSFVTPAGWHNAEAEDWDETTYLGSQTFPAGSSFFVSTQAAPDFYVSGQVETEPVIINAGTGFTPMGNSTPNSHTFSEITYTGLNDFDSLQFFDAAGETSLMAFWLSFVTPEGWHNAEAEDWDETTYLGDVIIPSGQGFFLSCQDNGVTVTIPGTTL